METFGILWDQPWFFLALLVLPVLAWRVWSKRGRGRVPASHGASFVAVSSVRSALWWVPDVLRMLGLVALVVTVARPRVAGADVQTGSGVDIMLTFDLSASMNGIDMGPKEIEDLILDKGELPRNRFEIARDILQQFVVERNKAAHDRIGLVVFGAQAWLKYPLTHDHARIIRTIEELVLDDGHQTTQGECSNDCTIPGNGTAIGDALGRAYSQLSRSEGEHDRIIILITDGKEEGGSFESRSVVRVMNEEYEKALDKWKKDPVGPEPRKIRVYTFLVGGKKGSDLFVPVTRVPKNWKKGDRPPRYDRPARPFETDPALLEEIAVKTDGKFYESYSEEKFKQDVGDLKQQVFESAVERPRVDVFEWPLLIGLILIFAEQLLRFTLFRSVV